MIMKNLRKFTLAFGVLGLVVAGCSNGGEEKTETIEENQTSTTDTAPTLSEVWKSDTTLMVVESVLYDAGHDVLYASCINGQPLEKNGLGFIAKLSTDGTILAQEFISGLNAPKGMGMVGNTLYVTDVDRVVSFNLETGDQLAEYAIDSASFLNDITVSPAGEVYVSGTNTKGIYKIANGEVSVWYNGGGVDMPNGLYHDGTYMWVVSYDTGVLRKINVDDMSIMEVASGFGGGDGVVPDGHGNVVVSDWNGQVWVYNGEAATQLLDTREQVQSADIEFVPATGMIYVPTFFGNAVAAYKLAM